MKTNVSVFFALLLAGASALTGVGIAHAQTTYTWTGADGANNAIWENALNWAGGLVPNGVSGQLSTDNASDVVIFDSETATFMPSGSILTRNSWTGSFKNPQIQVLNGTVTFADNLNWGWGNIETFIVGDGDMTTLAVANTGYTDLNRDPGNLKTYTVNADGTLIFRNNVIAFSNDGSTKRAQIQLYGGTVQFNGTINNHFTNAANNYINFNAIGSTFTAVFGGQLPDLATVQENIGPDKSFRSTAGLPLAAKDNGDTTFTVFIPPPAGTVLLIR